MDHPDKRAQIVTRPAGLADTFNEIPTEYDARPPYPDEVFELLAEHAGLGSGTTVLEIGPGTGHATIPMLDLGAQVTAVEPGDRLAQRLKERTEGKGLVEVIVATFEDAALPDASFDVVAAATAYHWVDPALGATKCARVLRDRGWLALWWTIWGDPRRPDPFHDALEPILRARAPQLLEVETPQAYERDLAARVAYVEATGAFEEPRMFALEWEGTHDPLAIRRLFGTFAPWVALAKPLRSELLAEVERLARQDFDGSVRRPYRTILYLMQRRPR